MSDFDWPAIAAEQARRQEAREASHPMFGWLNPAPRPRVSLSSLVRVQAYGWRDRLRPHTTRVSEYLRTLGLALRGVSLREPYEYDED